MFQQNSNNFQQNAYVYLDFCASCFSLCGDGRYIGRENAGGDIVLKFGMNEGLYVTLKTLIGIFKFLISFVSMWVLVCQVGL